MTQLGDTRASGPAHHVQEAALQQVSGGGHPGSGGAMWRPPSAMAAPVSPSQGEPGAVAFERLVRLARKNGDFPGILTYTGAGR